MINQYVYAALGALVLGLLLTIGYLHVENGALTSARDTAIAERNSARDSRDALASKIDADGQKARAEVAEHVLADKLKLAEVNNSYEKQLATLRDRYGVARDSWLRAHAGETNRPATGAVPAAPGLLGGAVDADAVDPRLLEVLQRADEQAADLAACRAAARKVTAP